MARVRRLAVHPPPNHLCDFVIPRLLSTSRAVVFNHRFMGAKSGGETDVLCFHFRVLEQMRTRNGWDSLFILADSPDVRRAFVRFPVRWHVCCQYHPVLWPHVEI